MTAEIGKERASDLAMPQGQKRSHYVSKERIVMAFCKRFALNVTDFMSLLPEREVVNVKKKMRCSAETDVLLKTSEDVQQVFSILDIVQKKN